MFNLRQSHPAGVSLPLVITLIILLMIASVTAYQLIFRSLKTADNIEDSNRAYFAAEAGVEDALYELSAHFAGYETPPLGDNKVRMGDFGGTVRWGNEWAIESMEPTGDFSGEFYAKSKLKVSFFKDASAPQTPSNQISVASANITPVNVSAEFGLTFSIPFDEEGIYSNFFTGQNNTLTIDNDSDLGLGNGSGPEGVDGLNEDGVSATADCGDGFDSKDGDCDGSQDEDSPEDPVVTCQAVDDAGRLWQPVDGCLTGVGSMEDPLGGEICEKDFVLNGLTGKIEATLNQDATGKDSLDGTLVTLGDFIEPGYQGRTPEAQVTLECLVVAPLVQVGATGTQKELPYLEYAVDTNADITGDGIPLPVFTIQSDGWYRDFKQSITTTLIPKESVPLLDITIIQQN